MSATDDSTTTGTRRPWRRRVLLLLVVAAGALGTWWWLDGGKHLFFPKNWGVVEEGRVYRSGRIHRRLIKDVLEEHGIRVVVDLAGNDDWDPNFQPERDAAKALGIKHVTFKGLDGHGIGSVDDYANAFAELLEARRAGQPILVHCGGGSERSGALFAWFRMLIQGWDGARAWEEYLHYRGGKQPKTDRLRTFVNEHCAEIARRAHERGLLERVPDELPVFGPAGAKTP